MREACERHATARQASCKLRTCHVMRDPCKRHASDGHACRHVPTLHARYWQSTTWVTSAHRKGKISAVPVLVLTPSPGSSSASLAGGRMRICESSIATSQRNPIPMKRRDGRQEQDRGIPNHSATTTFAVLHPILIEAVACWAQPIPNLACSMRLVYVQPTINVDCRKRRLCAFIHRRPPQQRLCAFMHRWPPQQ